MAIGPEGLGASVGPVWMGSREGSRATLEPWVAAVVVYNCESPQHQLVYPLHLAQATEMRDKLLALSTWTPPPKPKTPGERYAAMKDAKKHNGLSFTFDDPETGIHVTDRRSTPELASEFVGTVSFKCKPALGSIHAIPFTAEHFALFAKTLAEVLDRHVEPPE